MKPTPEQLLQPRYEVIADYPNSPFTIGEILYLTDECFIGNSLGYESYPKIFRKLEWWEHRLPHETPTHVKFVKDYMDFKEWQVFPFSNWNKGRTDTNLHDCIGFITGKGKYNKSAIPATYNVLLPATESDYQKYLNQ